MGFSSPSARDITCHVGLEKGSRRPPPRPRARLTPPRKPRCSAADSGLERQARESGSARIGGQGWKGAVPTPPAAPLCPRTRPGPAGGTSRRAKRWPATLSRKLKKGPRRNVTLGTASSSRRPDAAPPGESRLLVLMAGCFVSFFNLILGLRYLIISPRLLEPLCYCCCCLNPSTSFGNWLKLNKEPNGRASFLPKDPFLLSAYASSRTLPFSPPPMVVYLFLFILYGGKTIPQKP